MMLMACETPQEMEMAQIDLGEMEILASPQAAIVVDLLEGVDATLASEVNMEAVPASGEILVADETLIVFAPATDFDEGEDQFRVSFVANGARYLRHYRIRMGNHGQRSSCVMIFRPDRAPVNMNMRTSIPVLANDLIRECVPGATITRMGIRGPRFGSAQVNANHQLVYAPPHGYTGRDYLVYYVQLSDGTVGRALVWLYLQ